MAAAWILRSFALRPSCALALLPLLLLVFIGGGSMFQLPRSANCHASDDLHHSSSVCLPLFLSAALFRQLLREALGLLVSNVVSSPLLEPFFSSFASRLRLRAVGLDFLSLGQCAVIPL